MEMNVQVEVAARRFAGTDIAVINVMFPSIPASRAEVEAFNPHLLRVVEAENGCLALVVDGGALLTTLTPANGDLEGFKRLLDDSGIFVLNLMAGTEPTPLEGGKLVARTLTAENGQGRVISDSGVVEATGAEVAVAKAAATTESFDGIVLSDPSELAPYLNTRRDCRDARTLDPSQAN